MGIQGTCRVHVADIGALVEVLDCSAQCFGFCALCLEFRVYFRRTPHPVIVVY